MSVQPSFLTVTRQMSRRLARKLPIVFFAAVACYGLYYLDRVKNRFDETKARKIVVGDDFVARVRFGVIAKPDGAKAWEDLDSPFKKIYGSFNNGNEIIDALRERVIAEGNESVRNTVYPDEVAFKKCVNDQVNKKTQQDDIFAPCDVYRLRYEQGRSESIARAASQVREIYQFLDADSLRQISDEQEQALNHTSSGSRLPIVEESLQPTLSEKSGLYIIYQIFRITCAAVIVFSLIAVIAIMLRALLLADGVNTFIDKAKGLVGDGGLAGSSVARMAIASVAVVGLGTAVATGVAISGSHDRSGAADGDVSETSNYRLSLPNKFVTDLANQYDAEYYANALTQNSFNQSPPSVSVYPLIVPPKGDPPNVTVTSDPKTAARLQDYFDTLTKSNAELAKKLGELNSVKDISVANQKRSTTNDKDPLKVDLVGLMSDDEQKHSLRSTVDSLTTNLAKLNDLSTNLEYLYRPIKPEQKNFFGRLFGKDRYFISSRALAELKRTLPADDDNTAILKALDKTSNKAPLTEKELVSTLSTACNNQKDCPPWNDQIQKRFQLWKSTILAYTRVP